MTYIWYEVFPVTIVSQQPVVLLHRGNNEMPPWMIQNLSHSHPNDIVLQQLVSFFGDVFDPSHTIVHSTSWRYEHSSDRLLLTYLAVLPQGHWVEHIIQTGGISTEPIGASAKCYGDHLLPPERIERQAVLAHALDHLASLDTYDAAIQAALEPGWRDSLHARIPKPAGCLQHSSSQLVLAQGKP